MPPKHTEPVLPYRVEQASFVALQHLIPSTLSTTDVGACRTWLNVIGNRAIVFDSDEKLATVGMKQSEYNLFRDLCVAFASQIARFPSDSKITALIEGEELKKSYVRALEVVGDRLDEWDNYEKTQEDENHYGRLFSAVLEDQTDLWIKEDTFHCKMEDATIRKAFSSAIEKVLRAFRDLENAKNILKMRNAVYGLSMFWYLRGEAASANADLVD